MSESLAYLISSICFILALKGLASPSSARTGNALGIIGMIIAIIATFYHPAIETKGLIITGIAIGGFIGVYIAVKIKMTSMPQLVAAFHSLVGLAAVLIAASALLNPEAYNIGLTGKLPASNLFEMSLGSIIGAITFSGSVIAFAKLQGIMNSKPIRFKGQKILNIAVFVSIILLTSSFISDENYGTFLLFTLLAFFLGFLLIIPIGGADMPVVVSMLNSYSGWAAAGIGFTLNNSLLIITGALVGASGAILSYIMCKAMNRSIFNVIFGGLKAINTSGVEEDHSDRNFKTGSPEDAAFIMKNARSVIIVPGYGMAVAQAQHAIRELTELLLHEKVNVKFAIHPVAGRMPGHMNVLLAEANISYDLVYELEDINRDFKGADVALVIGANDVTNPAAKTDPTSPIYGMPILDVEYATNVFFIKRGMSSGYAGVENELFYRDNTIMIFGDAKKVVEQIVKSFED